MEALYDSFSSYQKAYGASSIAEASSPPSLKARRGTGPRQRARYLSLLKKR